MKRSLINILLFLALTGAYAQSLLEYYDSELISVDYGTLGGFTFVHDGEAYSAIFGLQQPLRDIIASHSRSTHFVETHVKNMRTGWILIISGLLATVGASYIAFTIPLATTETQFVVRTSGTLFLGGIALIFSIAGPLFMNHGYSSLLYAINIYNRDKIRQYRQP